MENKKENDKNHEKKQESTPGAEKLAEIEKKFEFLAQEASKSFLENTKNRHLDVENKIKEFIHLIEIKITKQCEKEIKNMMEVSENEQYYDQVRGNVMISRRPVVGKEDEFSLQSQNLMQCMKIYLANAETLLDYRNSYRQLNNLSYKFCIDECRAGLRGSFQNNSLNYEGVKFCLKDCYNLGSFNFKSYYQFMATNIDLKTEEFNKL
jgi:hypothetical protein